MVIVILKIIKLYHDGVSLEDGPLGDGGVGWGTIRVRRIRLANCARDSKENIPAFMTEFKYHRSEYALK